jgi:hypothetical protein
MTLEDVIKTDLNKTFVRLWSRTDSRWISVLGFDISSVIPPIYINRCLFVVFNGVPQSYYFTFKFSFTEYLKGNKSPGIHQIPAGLIVSLCLLVYVLFVIKQICLSSGRNLLFHLFKSGDKIAVIVAEGCHCYQLHTKFCSVSLKANSMRRRSY